jgi:hypothetical protein
VRRPQDQFLDKEVHVVFNQGSVNGVLEAVGDDGSLFIRQGARAVWIPLYQVRYVMLADQPPPDDWEPDK